MAYFKDLSGYKLIPNVWDLRVEQELRYSKFSDKKIYGVRDAWKEGHRFYHNCDHLQSIVTLINKLEEISEEDKTILIIAAAYHDIIYDPQSKINEVLSCRRFIADAQNTELTVDDINKISSIILATAERTEPPLDGSITPLANIFWKLDNSILDADLADLLEYEGMIYKEYQWASWPLYKQARISFLQEEFARTGNQNLVSLAEIIKARVPNIGLYIGSFDPFHIGHLNILQKSEKIFDKVIIARGKNPDKNNSLFDALPKCVANRETVIWDGLTTDLIKDLIQKTGTKVTLIRGLRDGKDLDYEINNLRFMEDLYEDIQVCFIHCDKQFEHVSSSAIRKLSTFTDVSKSKYLPT